MHKVFISYSRKDKDFVKRLTLALEPYCDIWIDFEDIPLASDWWVEVQRGIEQAECFISIIPPNYLASVICKGQQPHKGMGFPGGKTLMKLSMPLA